VGRANELEITTGKIVASIAKVVSQERLLLFADLQAGTETKGVCHPNFANGPRTESPFTVTQMCHVRLLVRAQFRSYLRKSMAADFGYNPMIPRENDGAAGED
jgi:hypothetical protein